MVKLLATIWDPSEVEDAVEGGADIIDVKDPSRGSLGTPEFSVLHRVLGEKPRGREVSVALGDHRVYNPLIPYSVYTASALGADYVKIGLETGSFSEALRIAREAVNAAARAGYARVVLVGYADYKLVGSIEPMLVVRVAVEAGADYAMIDTRVKNGVDTIRHLGISYLEEFVKEAHSSGVKTAVAGSLRIEHADRLASIGFDVIGFRTALCVGGRLGRLSRELVRRAKTIISSPRNNCATARITL